MEQTKRKVIDLMELPADLEEGTAKVMITGMQDVWIENYEKILACCPTEIVIATKKCRLCLKGRNLKVLCYTEDEMRIQGCLESIHFV